MGVFPVMSVNRQCEGSFFLYLSPSSYLFSFIWYAVRGYEVAINTTLSSGEVHASGFKISFVFICAV